MADEKGAISGKLNLGGAGREGTALSEGGGAQVRGQVLGAAMPVSAETAQDAYWRGMMLGQQQRLDEALACFRRAVELAPDMVAAWSHCGGILLRLEQADEALVCFDKALEHGDASARLFRQRGDALRALGRFEEAAINYDFSIQVEPENAYTLACRGHALLELQRLEDAVSSYGRAYALKPDSALVLGRLLHNKMKLADWSGWAPLLADLGARLALAEAPNPLVATPFAALSLLDDPSLQQRAARHYYQQMPQPPVAAPVFQPRKPGAPLRLGYFSADFGDHPVSQMLVGVLETHRRSLVEIHGFSLRSRAEGDAMNRRMAAIFGANFHDVSQMDDSGVAEFARQKGIDVAVDLMGYTTHSRSGVFHHRCAPVQVGYLGYPGTIGGPCLDYLLADPVSVPPSDRQYYDEKIVYLPRNYLANNPRRKPPPRKLTRSEFGLPEQGFVYCCFNSHYKITPPMFDAWMRILGAVPGSLLWLLRDQPVTMANLRQAAEARGIAGSRLIFSERLDESLFLGRYQVADLFLDTLPYNAHSTASDALRSGLPLLTCQGHAFPGRVASSLLQTLGLEELVTRDLDAYVAQAVALGVDKARLSRLKARLAENLQTTRLFDPKALARNLETAYIQMYERFRKGLPAEGFTVNDP